MVELYTTTETTNTTEGPESMTTSTVGPRGDIDYDNAEQGLSSSTGNDTKSTATDMKEKDLPPINGNCFAYIGLFYLFVDWVSYIPFIPAIKNIGFRHHKWNGNPVASIYDHNYSFAQSDPEPSTRRSLNVHAMAGFVVLFVAIFQLLFTFYFRRPQQQQQQQQEDEDEDKEQGNSTTTRNSSFSSFADSTARYLHRNLGRMLIVAWFFVYVSANVYFVAVIANKQMGKITAVIVFLYVGTISIVNIIVGCWAVATKQAKDYMLHKVCMGFAIIAPSGISYGRIVIMILQLYLGRRHEENCLLDSQILFDCFVVGYMLHFFLLTTVLYLYDKRFLLQFKSIQWNLFGIFFMTFVLCTVAVMNFSNSSFSMETMCIDY